MRRRSVALAVSLALSSLSGAWAQSNKLVFLIPHLYGSDGLVVDSRARLPDGSTHSAHFNSAFQSEFTQFNIALSSQLSTLPIPSPAAGFTFSFDSATGTFTRTTQSFGPIFAERAQTIGKNKLAVGFTVQGFTFDEVEGIDLDRVPAVFTHDDPEPGGKADVVTTVNSIDASVTQSTAFLTYGLTGRLDLSVAVPLVRTDLEVVSDATIQRLGTAGSETVHFFETASGGVGDRRRFSSSGSATGLGDVLLRLKGTAKEGRTGVALGVDVRLPTGDEEDFLGSGALGIKPFVAASFSWRNVHPHINLGYQWNDDSVLAGDPLTGEKADLPEQILFTVGTEIGVSSRLTLAIDLLGRQILDSPRLVRTTHVGLDPARTTFDNISFETESFSETDVALGLKVNPVATILVNLNLLIPLDDSGLRDDLTPLLGLEYSF